MAQSKISYQEAFEEIKKILEEIETGNISIDELSEKVKRASMLMEICRSKLKQTEEDVANILDSLDQEAT